MLPCTTLMLVPWATEMSQLCTLQSKHAKSKIFDLEHVRLHSIIVNVTTVFQTSVLSSKFLVVAMNIFGFLLTFEPDPTVFFLTIDHLRPQQSSCYHRLSSCPLVENFALGQIHVVFLSRTGWFEICDAICVHRY